MEDIQELIGMKVRQIRMYKGISQEELAARSVLHLSQIGYIERSERTCKLDTLAKIANGLNVEIYELFDFDNPYYEEKTIDEIQNELIKMLSRLNSKEQNDLLNIIKSIVNWKQRKPQL